MINILRICDDFAIQIFQSEILVFCYYYFGWLIAVIVYTEWIKLKYARLCVICLSKVQLFNSIYSTQLI